MKYLFLALFGTALLALDASAQDTVLDQLAKAEIANLKLSQKVANLEVKIDRLQESVDKLAGTCSMLTLQLPEQPPVVARPKITMPRPVLDRWGGTVTPAVAIPVAAGGPTMMMQQNMMGRPGLLGRRAGARMAGGSCGAGGCR